MCFFTFLDLNLTSVATMKRSAVPSIVVKVKLAFESDALGFLHRHLVLTPANSLKFRMRNNFVSLSQHLINQYSSLQLVRQESVHLHFA